MKTNYFIRIYRSLFDFDLYKKAVKEKLSKAFIYLLIFSILLGLLHGIIPVYQYLTQSKDAIESIKDDIPEFEVVDGKLEYEGSWPYVLSEDYSFLIAFSKDEKILDDYPNGIVLTETQIVLKSNNEPLSYYSLDTISTILSKDRIVKLIESLRWIIFLIFIFIFFGIILYRYIVSAIVALVSFIVAKVAKTDISFQEAYIVGIYAATPTALIRILVKYINIPNFPIMLVTTTYLVVFLYLIYSSFSKKDNDIIQNNENNTII